MQESMFDLAPIPKRGSKFTSQAYKAIDWYAKNYGLKIEISIPPKVTFSMPDLGEKHTVDLLQVVDEYRNWRKEESKRKAREKRMEIKHGR